MTKKRTFSRKGMIGISAALATVMVVPGVTAAQDDTMDDAMIRVLHGADAPAVDIWLNGAPGVEGLAFGENTGYVALADGEYQIQVVPAGAGIDDPANIVVDATVPFEAGTKTTIVATGSLDTGIVPQLVADDPVPTAEMADVKVGHMSWDAPAVDILAGGAAVVEGLEFPNVAGPLSVPGGAYDFDVAVAGTDTIAIDIPEITLDNGVAYSVYAIGSLANDSLTAVALVDADTRQANVRVAHLSPDAPAVDVFVNGAAALEGVPFGDISSYLEVAPGEYQIQVAPEGAGAESAVIDATLTFGPGTWTTVAAANNVADITPLVFKDAAPVVNAEVAQLRAYHASADAPAKVDIATDGAAKKKAAIKKLKFGKNTGFLELPAGALDLDIRQPGTKKVLVDIPALDLEVGKVYSAFAATQPDGSIAIIANVDAE
jgi:hypothetical protein